MVSPNDDPTIFDEWKALALRLAQTGASLEKISQEIGRTYHCAATTARAYLDAAFREKRRAAGRRSERRRYSKQKARQNRIRHFRHYRRITRYPDKHLLPHVFRPESELDLQTITERARQLAEGTQFRPETIERVLKRYAASEENRARGPPYLTELPDGWRYSNERPDDDDEDVQSDENNRVFVFASPLPALLSSILQRFLPLRRQRPRIQHTRYSWRVYIVREVLSWFSFYRQFLLDVLVCGFKDNRCFELVNFVCDVTVEFAEDEMQLSSVMSFHACAAHRSTR